MSRGERVAPPLLKPSTDPVPLLVHRQTGLRVSKRAFWELCRANRDLRLERTARGELVVMTPAGTESGGRNARLTQRLGNWADSDGTGRFFDSSTGFTLSNGATVAPDASWLAGDRWAALSVKERKKFAPICPDFVAELQLPSDERDNLREKMRQYIDQGARLGWLIDPTKHEVEVYRPGRPAELLKRPAAVSGEDVLPGFVLDLKGILFD